ncbi:hypothetical protein MJO28_016959 [Puccinia striiformis f. sp. tritici]|nr:hypothetical protein MJO28_016959 [Puccinia striiformis f. sp. tritici]
MIRQFCNHPIFCKKELNISWNWRWQDSAKLVHLVENLKEFLRGGRGIRRPKAVVFSSYVAYLEIIKKALTEIFLESMWLIGSLSLLKQDESLAQFRSDQNCNILLASIQAAGVEIDLRCAQNIVILKEPNWNPATEAQAVDRLYHLGQTHEVHVYQYYIQRTLEKYVRQVQKKERGTGIK